MAELFVRTERQGRSHDTGSLVGSNVPLPHALARLEGAFDWDLSQIRIHADESAAQAASARHARAFTTGNDVFFARGALQPATEPGARLLAHEVAHTIQQVEGMAPRGVAQLKEDWDFTPADYESLLKAKGKLTFGADSSWFPKALQENLLTTLDFVLKSKKPVRTEGVSVTDFYHAHFTVPANSVPNALSTKKDTFGKKEDELEAKALGGSSANDVTKENLKDFTKAMQKVEAAATPLLEDALKVKGAAVFYHTFEGRGPSMPFGSATRNIMTPIGGTPSGYDPSGTGADANAFRKDNFEILQFAFLVDEKGVVHVTVGTVPNLSRVTGTPLTLF